MRPALALLALAALAVAQPARSQDIFHEPPRVVRLSNGLTVITARTDAPGVVAYSTLVRVGSRDEIEAGHSGYAHLFEHMMFRGTERYPQDAYEARIQSLGADNNAYTTNDFTLYGVVAPSSALDAIVELEADRFQHLSYAEAAYRTETGAVRGEYDVNIASPSQRMWESLSELAFTRHTYGHTTMGYLRDIDAMPDEFEYSRRFFTRFYTPDNCTIIVAGGDVDHEAVLALVRAQYGGWRGRAERPRIPSEPEPTAGARRHIDWPSTATPQLLLGYRTPAFESGRRPADRARALRDTAALRVVHGLLFSESSATYQRLVIDEQRLLSLESWADDLARDPHLLVAQASLAEGADFDSVLADLQAAIDAIGRGEVEAERIEAVKSHVRYAMLSALTDPSAVADLIARFVAVGGELGALDRYLESLAAVTAEDVARVARAYLSERRRFVVTLAHGAASEEPAQ